LIARLLLEAANASILKAAALKRFELYRLPVLHRFHRARNTFSNAAQLVDIAGAERRE
jgi:hypothetical protein